MWRIKRFVRRIRNLIRWFPVIWKDEDWDHYFIFEILKFKLKNQAEYIGNKDRHVSAKRDAEIMMTCVRLIDKIQNSFYDVENADYFNQEVKFVESKSFPGYFEMEDGEILLDKLEDYFAKYPLIYNKIKSDNVNLSNDRIARKIAQENHIRAVNLLFKILSRNIQKWWD